MVAPKEILDLVERFGHNVDAYRSGQYNETQLRREFIDPFFKALGWDVDNEQGYAEAYKDVIHEDSVKIDGSTKAPDYGFRIGGTRKFFVEAKKPSVNIDKDIGPAYQLRRYAWSANLPLSILSDFEELAVYDCRFKPEKADKASKARTIYIKYHDYADRWDEIAAIFSREAVLKGSFDQYVESSKRKRGTAEVDNAFLQEIESWRETLARNIALRNQELNSRDLNHIVQATIDRIVFLRICEDRGVEKYGNLKTLLEGDGVYSRLTEFFYLADERYNSGLFHFQEDPGRQEPPDELSLNLSIDDKPLKDIIKNLYYPDSPYEFSVISPEILGKVYEQFLGKVIRLTDGHRAKVEYKPEVRKAGGVYYTPSYIVDYIVENTVGKLLESSTPKKATDLKILDPACGSGSFLIGAYQYLLDWHRDWYVDNVLPLLDAGKATTSKEIKKLLPDGHSAPKNKKRSRKRSASEPQFPIFQAQGGEWKLSIAERKRILLNNIHGVDIDPQAVEVTKLSLHFKVLEGENQETISKQLKLFQERALPDLGNNIKCGNSLIGPDFYDNQTTLLDEEEMRRINTFDWLTEFSEIMGNGGFDAVLGNPPYVDIKGLPNKDMAYLFSTYPSANNRINLFACFIEQSLSISRSSRYRFSMIIPTALLTQDSYCQLRRLIIENYQIDRVVRLPNELFGASAGDVKVDTAIVVLREMTPKQSPVVIIGYSGYDRITKIDRSKAHINGVIDQTIWAGSDDCIWSLNTTEVDMPILRKCDHNSVPLIKCTEVSLGLTPYDKYKGHTQEQIKNKVFHADYKKDENFKKLLAGNDVLRYGIQWNGNHWISYGPWLGAPRDKRFFTEKRIIVKQIIDWTTKRIWASITDEELYNTQNAFNLLARSEWVPEYILGILNSRLLTFYHRKKFLDEFKMRFQKILIKDCKQFPIRTINFSDPEDVARHDQMVELVNRMLELNKKLPETKAGHEKTLLQRQIDTTDRQIDRLVYDLYDLTEEEIKIVENAIK